LHKTAFPREEKKGEKGDHHAEHAPSAHALEASGKNIEAEDVDDNQSSSRQSEEEVVVLEDRLEGNLLDDKYHDLKQLLKQQQARSERASTLRSKFRRQNLMQDIDEVAESNLSSSSRHYVAKKRTMSI
jgi:hypothetical protein